MRDEDKRTFKALMVSTMEVYGKAISTDAIRLWWACLQGYELADVSRAFSAHVTGKRGQFAPLPADILELIRGESGHLGTEEAWALALESTDEALTVVWTDEIAQALAVARPCLEIGDKIGARQAFVSAYERNVMRASSVPVWKVSAGHDISHRQITIQAAVDAGRLKHEAVAHLLPPPETTESRAVAGLMTGKTEGAPAGLDPRWKQLGEQIRQQAAETAKAREAAKVAESEAFERKRHDAIKALEVGHG